MDGPAHGMHHDQLTAHGVSWAVCAARPAPDYGPLACLELCFFFSSRRRHTRCYRDWSSDVCSSDLMIRDATVTGVQTCALPIDRKSTRLNSSHGSISVVAVS